MRMEIKWAWSAAQMSVFVSIHSRDAPTQQPEEIHGGLSHAQGASLGFLLELMCRSPQVHQREVVGMRES